MLLEQRLSEKATFGVSIAKLQLLWPGSATSAWFRAHVLTFGDNSIALHIV